MQIFESEQVLELKQGQLTVWNGMGLPLQPLADGQGKLIELATLIVASSFLLQLVEAALYHYANIMWV